MTLMFPKGIFLLHVNLCNLLIVFHISCCEESDLKGRLKWETRVDRLFDTNFVMLALRD